MKCLYCQLEMKHYGYSNDDIWMCQNHYNLNPLVRVDHYYFNQELYKIKLIVFRHNAQFPYDITLDLVNKITKFYHLPDAVKVIDYGNDDQWKREVERMNRKEEALFVLDHIPENINPDTVNRHLDRYIKLLTFC